MATGFHDEDRSGVSEQEAKLELDRLLADPRFHATDRAKSILKYVAQQSLDGRTEHVKAYSIAIDVLNRPTSFDPNTDPIVRIEISRLRLALSNYYEAYGSSLDVTIHLPVGKYLVLYEKKDVSEQPAQDDGRAYEASGHLTASAGAAQTMKRRIGERRVLALTLPCVVLLAVLSGGVFWTTSSPSITERPLVRIGVSATDEAHLKEADVLGDFLVAALMRFRTLNILSDKDITTASVATVQDRHVHSYDIDVKYYSNTDSRIVSWRVVTAAGRATVESGVESVTISGRSEEAAREELVSLLARRFGGTRGVINALETHHHDQRVLGNSCVLRAEFALETADRAGVARSIQCLQRTVKAQPGNSDAAALLARTLSVSADAPPDASIYAQALASANRAISLDPTSDRAQIALMMVQFYGGRMEAAIAAGNRAIALNPNNPDVSAKLAGVLSRAGYWEAAVSLAEEASKDVDTVPRAARLVLALDAYRRGDFPAASLAADQINASDFVVQAIRMAALGEIGSPEARQYFEAFEKKTPAYQQSFRALMEFRRYPPELIDSLERGLIKAAALKGNDVPTQ
ncbi:Tetratricopeptide repeat protein [Neorhizobium galegae bv. orientalis]|nr:Tetratricopeptide repeat protein [Neorhizobium galegae bv. orientalis]